MKKVVFLMYFCFGISHAQIINFPDANFKARLLQASPSNGIAYSSSFGYIKIDVNNNGEIEQIEALKVNNLNIISQNISNLEGLQYFTNLTTLNAYTNNVSTINLTTLTNLVYLECFNNQLTSLNVTGLTHLEELVCYNNLISQLDFSGLPNLKRVYCGNNQITFLDFSYNPLFEELGCKNNPNLTSIKIRNSHQQIFGSQTLLNECWTGCPNLNYICADAFEIPALQSYLAGCGITQSITIDSACPLLGNDWFEVKEFSVSPNPSASVFTITLQSLLNKATLSVYNLMGQSVYSTTISTAEVYSLDMSAFSSGCYLLKITNGDETFTTRIIKE
jgi:Leucine-rich repeat (LRR) protein